MPPRTPSGKREKPKDASGTLLRILRYLTHDRNVMLVMLLLTLLSNAGNLLGPSFAGKALGAALDAGEKEDLAAMVAGGMKVNKLDPQERQHWKELIETETKAIWMKEIEGKISPERANEIYDHSKAVFAKYEAALSAK